MEIVVCGVRGSTPAPGERFVRVGGNTSCLAVRAPGGRWLVLDAGTGFRRMADVLDGAPFCGSVLLTHLHWDHTQGLPFLANADRSDAEVHLHLPEQEGRGAADVLARAMSPPHFPIRPEELVGSWTFEFMAPGVHLIEGLEVTAAEITHKGGRTFGYRISDGERAIAYLPDHAPNIAGTEALERAVALASGVDLLFHDSQFTDRERSRADEYGHSTISDAIAFAERAGVGRLALFHHAPDRSDDEVFALGPSLAGAAVPVSVVCEGEHITVAPGLFGCQHHR